MDQRTPVPFHFPFFLCYFFLNHGIIRTKGTLVKNPVDVLDAEVQPPVEHDVEKLSHILIAVAPVAVFQLLRSDDALFFIKTERVAADAQSFRHVSNRILLHNRIPSFFISLPVILTQIAPEGTLQFSVCVYKILTKFIL